MNKSNARFQSCAKYTQHPVSFLYTETCRNVELRKTRFQPCSKYPQHRNVELQE